MQEIRLNAQETDHLTIAERCGGIIRQQAQEAEAEATAADVRAAKLAALCTRLLGEPDALDLARAAMGCALAEAEQLRGAAALLRDQTNAPRLKALDLILRERGVAARLTDRIWRENGLAVIDVDDPGVAATG